MPMREGFMNTRPVKELDMKAIHITLKDNETGKVYVDGDFPNALISVMLEDYGEEGQQFNAMAAGAFSPERIIGGLESIMSTVVYSLKSSHDAPASAVLKILLKMVNHAIDDHYDKNEIMNATLSIMMD